MARAGQASAQAGTYSPGASSRLSAERPLPGLLQAVVAEGALLHDALGPHRDVRVLPGRLLLVAMPVEVLRVVRAGRHAEAAADAARVDLRHDPLGVPVGGVDGADLGAGRVVALQARPRAGTASSRRRCSSSSSVSTCIQLMIRPRAASFAPTAGTLFSALQAMTQAWQPVQRSRSITIPQSAMLRPCMIRTRVVLRRPKPLNGSGSLAMRSLGLGPSPPKSGMWTTSGRVPAVELGLEPDPALGRLDPDPVPVLHPQPRRRLRVDLHPPLPGRPDVDRRLLQEPGLVPPASHGPAHQAVGVETERERPRLPRGEGSRRRGGRARSPRSRPPRARDEGLAPLPPASRPRPRAA